MSSSGSDDEEDVELPVVETMEAFVAVGKTNHAIAKSVVQIAKQLGGVEPDLLSSLNKMLQALEEQQTAIEVVLKKVTGR